MKDELVKLLVDAGIDKSEAEKKVTTLYNTVKQIRLHDSEDKIWAIVKLKVKQFVQISKRSRAKIFKGICLGFSEYRDMLAGIRASILAEYERDPQRAIAEGLVRIEGDRVIPLDNRPTLPSGDPNPNYGKPIPEIWRRDVYMAVEDKFVQVYGNVKDEPEVGGVYVFAGNPKGENIIALSRVRPMTLEGKIGDKELWTVTYNVLGDYAVDIGGLLEWHEEHANNPARIAAIKGVVTYTTETSTGNTLVVVDDIDDPTGDGIPVFANPAVVSGPVGVGVEVIAFGRTTVSTNVNGDEMEARAILNAFGVIVNPETTTYADVMQQLDEVLWSE